MTCGVPDGTTTVTAPFVLPAAWSCDDADAGRATEGALAVLPATTPRLRLWDWSHASPEAVAGVQAVSPAQTATTAAAAGSRRGPRRRATRLTAVLRSPCRGRGSFRAGGASRHRAPRRCGVPAA